VTYLKQKNGIFNTNLQKISTHSLKFEVAQHNHYNRHINRKICILTVDPNMKYNKTPFELYVHDARTYRISIFEIC
jgi:hypothetical protein